MNTKAQIAQETRQRLLQAASKIVLEQGVARLTLDAVAKEAGVSKGGLLYHFPSKDALVSGLLDDFIRDFKAATTKILASEIDGEDGTPGKLLSAYVRVNTEEDTEELALSAGLLAAVATNPALLDSWRDFYGGWQKQIASDGIDPVMATIVRLASDGLWINELFQIAPLEPATRDTVVKRLLTIATGYIE